ncbi:MAG TPA: hypothetical protein VKH19_06110 [Gemmatimonadaceae bacterium]|nr:hypothetical protein [Gemmatimonadaceae bacterium]
MGRRWTRSFAVSFLCASIAACSDSTGPGTDSELALDFCASDAPIFFAYQNDGGAWTALTPDASVTYHVPATEKIALAFVHQFGSSYSTEVIYGTRSELEPLAGVNCTDAAGSKTLNGSVTGASLGSDVWITMADQTTVVSPPPSTFSLNFLPDGVLDLVANRDAFTVNSTVPDRIIVRRAINLTNGATMPALDFASAEALAPATNSLTISGMLAGETTSLDVAFSTATVQDHDLYYVPSFTTSPQAIYSIPATLTQAGDSHTLDVYASDPHTTGYRGVMQFYRTPADRVAALGPALSQPTFSALSASPVVRVRMTLPVQAQYSSFANAYHVQTNGATSRVVSVTGTAGYFGSIGTWELDIPDLSSLSGYPIASGIQPSLSYASEAQAYGGSASLFFGGAPEEGEVLKYAGYDNPNATVSSASLRAPQSTRAPRREIRNPFARMRGR